MKRASRWIRVGLLGVLACAGPAAAREIYELQHYSFETEEKAEIFDAAMKEAGLEAFRKAGAGKLAVFKPQPGTKGAEKPARYLLASYPSLEAFGKRGLSLGDGVEAGSAVEAYLTTPMKDPVFTRMNSSLLLGFKSFPDLKDPEGEGDGNRYFELRIYESHNELKAKRKVEMFDEGGETALFAKTGLNPLFMGAAVVGTNLPNLTYMLVYENEAEKKKAWKTFLESPEWAEMKSQEVYADTVSKIHSHFLVALPYSPVK